MLEKKLHKPWHAHRHCVICGHQNPLGLKIHFHEVGDSCVEAEWQVSDRVQGYAGLMQGGVTAALLDSAMVNALRYQEIEAYTAEISVRYLHAIPIGAKVKIEGKVLRSRKNLHWTEATLHHEGTVMATASAKFLQASLDK